MKKYLFWGSVIVNVVFLGLVIRHYVVAPKKDKNPPLTYFVNRNVVLDGLPKDSTDILFIGDSQIQGFDITELLKNLKVKNRGIYYDSTKGVLHRVEAAAKGHPAKIFLSAGINDIENEVPADTISNNLQKAIDLIRANSPSTLIYINSVLPTKQAAGDDMHNMLPLVLKLNERYKALTIKNNITFIDITKYFLGDGLLAKYDVGDGIHLNAAGYLLWKDILLKYVNE